MDFTAISGFIQNIGVTAAVLVAACYYIKYHQTDNYRADIERLNELHKEEMDSITTALNNNTAILTKLEILLADQKNHG